MKYIWAFLATLGLTGLVLFFYLSQTKPIHTPPKRESTQTASSEKSDKQPTPTEDIVSEDYSVSYDDKQLYGKITAPRDYKSKKLPTIVIAHGLNNTLEQYDMYSQLLAKQGIRHYTPHDAKVLRAVLQPEPIVWQKYERTGAIRHADWQQRRVDFQPFPFQSYSELLVKLLKETHLAGVNTFLNDVQPEKAARELFDTRFVERALQRDGLMSSFGLQSLQRQKTFAL